MKLFDYLDRFDRFALDSKRFRAFFLSIKQHTTQHNIRPAPNGSAHIFSVSKRNSSTFLLRSTQLQSNTPHTQSQPFDGAKWIAPRFGWRFGKRLASSEPAIEINTNRPPDSLHRFCSLQITLPIVAIRHQRLNSVATD